MTDLQARHGLHGPRTLFPEEPGTGHFGEKKKDSGQESPFQYDFFGDLSSNSQKNSNQKRILDEIV